MSYLSWKASGDSSAVLIWVPDQRELRAAVDNQCSMPSGYSEPENESARSEHERLPHDQVVPAEHEGSELYVGGMQGALMDSLLAEPFSNPEEPAITEAGVADLRTRQILQWSTTYIFRLNLLAALLNRWGEFFGLESRVNALPPETLEHHAGLRDTGDCAVGAGMVGTGVQCRLRTSVRRLQRLGALRDDGARLIPDLLRLALLAAQGRDAPAAGTSSTRRRAHDGFRRKLRR